MLKLRKEDDASMVLFVYTVFFTAAVTMYSCYYINTLNSFYYYEASESYFLLSI